MGLVRDLENVRHLLFLAHYIFSVNVVLRSISILIADCHFIISNFYIQKGILKNHDV